MIQHTHTFLRVLSDPISYLKITEAMKNFATGKKASRYLVIYLLLSSFVCSNAFLASAQNAEVRQSSPDSIFVIPNTLPEKKDSFIERAEAGQKSSGFTIRGTKGWSWTPEQYMAEIPVLAKYKMNFLMNCYLSMFSGPLHPDSQWVSRTTKKLNTKNEWWLPIPEEKKRAYEKVFAKAKQYGINFCFGIHPQLSTSRPANLSNEKDFEDIWQHYAWAQSKGVRWFSIPLDDVSKVKISGAEHAAYVNKILNRLREKDKDVQMVFCPTYYYANPQIPKHMTYLKELAKDLDKDVYVFWTGKSVLPSTIKMEHAEIIKKLVNHRMILWDNFPTNDAGKTMHLAPLTGRDKKLYTVIDGYMSNPFFLENETNRIPLFTQADYAYDPENYDPSKSIGQAIIHQTDHEKQRFALLELVKLYASHISIISVRYNPVVDRYLNLTKVPFSSYVAETYIQHLKNVQDKMTKAFSGKHHIEAIKTLEETTKLIESNHRLIYK